MKIRSAALGILALAIIAVILISGCTEQPAPEEEKRV